MAATISRTREVSGTWSSLLLASCSPRTHEDVVRRIRVTLDEIAGQRMEDRNASVAVQHGPLAHLVAFPPRRGLREAQCSALDPVAHIRVDEPVLVTGHQ